MARRASFSNLPCMIQRYQFYEVIYPLRAKELQRSIKELFGASLSLRNYNAQFGETYAMIKALNKLTRLGMPEAQYIV